MSFDWSSHEAFQRHQAVYRAEQRAALGVTSRRFTGSLGPDMFDFRTGPIVGPGRSDYPPGVTPLLSRYTLGERERNLDHRHR